MRISNAQPFYGKGNHDGKQHLVEPVHHHKRKAGRAAHSGEKKCTAFTPEDVTRNEWL